MKKINVIFYAILLLFVSCATKEEDDNPDDVKIGDPSSSLCLLDQYSATYDEGEYKEIYELSYNEDSYVNGITVTEVSEEGTESRSFKMDLDDQGRIIKIYDNQSSFRTDYTYDEMKMTAISIYEWTSGDESYVEKEKMEYKFNAAKQVTEVKDFFEREGVWYEGENLWKFEWSNNNVIRIENLKGSNFTVSPQYRMPYDNLMKAFFPPTKQRKKYLIQRKESLSNARNSDVEYSNFSVINMEYDDKFNPFKPMQMALNGYADGLTSASNNNVTKSSYSDVSGWNFVETYVLTYNDKGYPTIQEATLTDDTYTDQYTFEYEYECD